MNRIVFTGLALGLLTFSGCASGTEALANDFYAAVESGNAAQFKSVAEKVGKLSQDEQKQFGEAFKKVMESKVGNNPAKALEFLGKMMAVAKDVPGMGGMPGFGGGGFLGGAPAIPGGMGFGGGAPNPGGAANPGGGFFGGK